MAAAVAAAAGGQGAVSLWPKGGGGGSGEGSSDAGSASGSATASDASDEASERRAARAAPEGEAGAGGVYATLMSVSKWFF